MASTPLPIARRVHGLARDQLKNLYRFIRHSSKPSLDLVESKFLPTGRAWYGRVAVKLTQELLISPTDDSEPYEVEHAAWVHLTHARMRLLQQSRCVFQFLPKPEEARDWNSLTAHILDDPTLIDALSHGTALTDAGEDIKDIMEYECFAKYIGEQQQKQTKPKKSGLMAALLASRGEGGGGGGESPKKGTKRKGFGLERGTKEDEDEDDDEEEEDEKKKDDQWAANTKGREEVDEEDDDDDEEYTNGNGNDGDDEEEDDEEEDEEEEGEGEEL